jgi:hypothetical protein
VSAVKKLHTKKKEEEEEEEEEIFLFTSRTSAKCTLNKIKI